jgi:eukaryotic-like serine/threonine-protein kinase
VQKDIRDDDRLLVVASKIDDDQPIDWDTAEVGARDDDERAVLAELRLLATLTRVSRDPWGPLAVTVDQLVSPSQEPVTWGTLTILEPVGQGGYARVYRARDTLGREVALKLFPVAREGDSELAARVLREGSLLAKVKHPNVVVVHGVDRSSDIVGLWMEFINGRTLEDELRARGTLGAEEAKTIGVDLCRAVAAVHNRGLLHRDIKATNVMREEGGRTVLMDFGSGSEQTDGLSVPKDVAGTPLYLAPELFERRPATRASDVYSLGVLLYHLVTGSYPVDGADRTEIRGAHHTQKRRKLRDSRSDLDTGFVQAVERALAADPRHRFQTAGEFEEALAGSGRDQMPTTDWFLWLRRAAAVAAVALLVAIPAWLVLRTRQGGPDSAASGLTPTAGPSVESSQPAAAAVPSYSVKAAFYRQRNQQETPLAPNDRVAPGDGLGLRLEASTPVHVYVMTFDDRGESYLLFPVPGLKPGNPLAPGQGHRLPGSDGNDEILWQVTSVGGREHFLVFVNPTPLTAFEPMLKALPRPITGRKISYSRIPEDVIGQLRGVGGLVAANPARKPSGASPWFETVEQLRGDVETARGPWVRQLTLENPGR